jgi:hypothetical protein
MDQRAHHHVLGPVRSPSDEVQRTREGKRQPQRRDGQRRALHDDHRQGDPGPAEAACDDEAAEAHPDRPRTPQQTEPDVARIEDVLREEHLRRRRGRHEQQRNKRDAEDEAQHVVAHERKTIPSRARSCAR